MSRFIVSPHAQQSEGWFADRAGRATGSKADCIRAKGKGKAEAATRADYRHDLTLERLTGRPVPSYLRSADLDWGNATEPFARMAMEAETGLLIEEAGFCYLPNIMAGCSVDGFVTDGGRKGFVEAKCPKSKTHLIYLDKGEVPSEYRFQVIHNFWITDSDFCDFCSYDPRYPDGLKLMITRVERDQAAIDEHEASVMQFLAEVDQLEARLRLRIRAS